MDASQIDTVAQYKRMIEHRRKKIAEAKRNSAEELKKFHMQYLENEMTGLMQFLVGSGLKEPQTLFEKVVGEASVGDGESGHQESQGEASLLLAEGRSKAHGGLRKDFLGRPSSLHLGLFMVSQDEI
ncbi:hypothetical protein KFL_008990020 [Klebsormidium nitens]|uniref:Uncharacterized protein n=1 Tax=Klebsormidium nitens TaxID=105231 RepID=A0A1Y1IM86_KLENI|nr:hypothetical protein KFL_008990020 [Klebsormidium nitens]|eukprot:GAQ91990.1 hypothetical protein KFL_008990020 [Klebsormidium nitens]